MIRDQLVELYILKKILILDKKIFGEPPVPKKSQYIWKLQV